MPQCQQPVAESTAAWSDFVTTKGRNESQGVDMDVILQCAAVTCCKCVQQGMLQREVCYGCWHGRGTQDKKTG